MSIESLGLVTKLLDAIRGGDPNVINQTWPLLTEDPSTAKHFLDIILKIGIDIVNQPDAEIAIIELKSMLIELAYIRELLLELVIIAAIALDKDDVLSLLPVHNLHLNGSSHSQIADELQTAIRRSDQKLIRKLIPFLGSEDREEAIAYGLTYGHDLRTMIEGNLIPTCLELNF